LRREHPTPASTATLDMVVAELGRTRDNLKEAVANLEGKALPAGVKPVLDELVARAREEGVYDLDYGPDPYDKPPPEPLDEATATSYDHRGEVIQIESASEDRARAALQVLREKAARRQLSPKLFQAGDPKTVGKGRGQIDVRLNAGINDELARDLRKRIQNVSNKLQVRIQGDQLRVVSKDKDTLQQVIKTLRDAEDIPVPLQFTNYR